jgi:serine/threonine protein phosphatase 1
MSTTSSIFAFGDIHGCARALEALLNAVAPPPGSTIVTLGDYVDRGLDSFGVIERLIRISATHQLVPLRGNHEEMMMNARSNDGHLELWKRCGGDTALISYAPDEDSPGLDAIPQTHWDFLDHQCRDLFETDNYFFVHGGVDPELPLSRQPRTMLYWQSFPPARPHVSGKTMICGHTPQRSGLPAVLPHAICIDTAAGFDGWLTCMELSSNIIWQANERGQTRQLTFPVPRRQ